LDKIRAELRAANLNTTELATKLKEKDSQLRSYAKKDGRSGEESSAVR
jgi:ribosome-binding protein aMBF1 (putative translation factor)